MCVSSTVVCASSLCPPISIHNFYYYQSEALVNTPAYDTIDELFILIMRKLCNN